MTARFWPPALARFDFCDTPLIALS